MNSAEVTLDPQPASVSRARRWLSNRLEEWGLEDLDYDMSVVLSELVTNAVLHARSEVTLRLIRGDMVRLEVIDSSPVLPRLRGHGARNTTGRGLHLVSALATSWGCGPHGKGKVVWAEFAESGSQGGDGPTEKGSAEAPAPLRLEPRSSRSSRSSGPRLRRVA